MSDTDRSHDPLDHRSMPGDRRASGDADALSDAASSDFASSDAVSPDALSLGPEPAATVSAEHLSGAEAGARSAVPRQPVEQTDPPLEQRDDLLVVPVVQEELRVDTRKIETGRVRVIKTVTRQEQVVDRPLRHQHVEVERVAVNRFVDQVPEVRHDGDLTIIPVVEEVLVVERRLMLREEVKLRVRQTVEHRPTTVSVRSEQVEIRRDRPGEPGERTGHSQREDSQRESSEAMRGAGEHGEGGHGQGGAADSSGRQTGGRSSTGRS